MFLFHALRAAPFSMMALCNIIGDLCYLGFAFESEGWVSAPKLGGACFAMMAHAFLLAYGDDKTSQNASREKGPAARTLAFLSTNVQRRLQPMPTAIKKWLQRYPVGIPFGMLALNGLGLLADAVPSSVTGATLSQLMLGLLITLGCGSFALADFVKDQKTTNVLLKLAPSLLTGASMSNLGLGLTTLNPFVLLSVVAFGISSLTGFFTKIDKTADFEEETTATSAPIE